MLLKIAQTSNNSIRRCPRGAINFAISCIASISRCFLSSFDTPQYGVMSPTIDSAKSCTNANKNESKFAITKLELKIQAIVRVQILTICSCIVPNSMHFVRSKSLLSSNRNVITLMRYMCPAIDSQSSTWRNTQPVRFKC